MTEIEPSGKAIRRMREKCGLSLRELAKLASMDYGHLSKIENGHRTTTPSVAGTLDRALSAKGALIALAQVERSARIRRAVPLDPMRRRTLVTWGLTAPALPFLEGTGAEAPRTMKIGMRDVVELEQSAAWLYKLDYQHGGAMLWQSASHAVRMGYGMLESGQYGEVVENRLLKATARIQMCAGWLAFDGGRHDIARSFYTEALAIARQTSDSEVETHALSNLAFQSNVLGRPREAARLSEGAMRAASLTQDKAGLAAIPYLRRAIAASLSGDHKEQDKSIAAARKVVDRDSGKPTEEWCSFLGPAELNGVEGTCLVELGYATRAEKLFEKAVQGYGCTYGRNRALYRVRLARARLDQNFIDGASEAASQAVGDLDVQVASWRVRDELNAVAARLALHVTDPTAADFTRRYGRYQESISSKLKDDR